MDYTNLEMAALDLTIGYKYWWNDDNLSMPFPFSKYKLLPVLRTPRKARVAPKGTSKYKSELVFRWTILI